MIVTRTADAAFTVQFESEEELRNEHRTNLSAGGLRIPTLETVRPNTHLVVTIRGPWGTDVVAKAMVVAQLPDGIAVAIEENPGAMLDSLLTKTVEPAAPADEGDQKTSWDRLRGLSQTEKILLAVKADRAERAVLIQDNDPRVLLSVLRNPRLTVDEVVRIAKSSFLNYQIADVIMKTGQWMANADVRLGLVHNPKTPEAFSLRILPTLPDSEVRAIARAGTRMSLKQAALRRLQGKS
jgi:hypothetical protein